MLLARAYWPLPFDIYLLRFLRGQGIPPHTDQVQSGKHYRLNLVIKAARSGGEFYCSHPIYESKRVKLFRSDISEHGVSEVTQGSRYVVSIGWIKK